MFLFIKDKEKPLWQVCLFKYISCSYLSNEFPYGGFWVDRFKYISCSYLSHVEIVANSEQQDLNTSHVLIYRNSVFLSLNCPSDLNTSHVLIYRLEICCNCDLFIFKYISCSYLSLDVEKAAKLLQNLNTSHVLIYQVTTIDIMTNILI